MPGPETDSRARFGAHRAAVTRTPSSEAESQRCPRGHRPGAGEEVRCAGGVCGGAHRECEEFVYVFAEETRSQVFGAVTPGYDFMARLRSGVESVLPPDAHRRAHGRLHVSVSCTRTRRNVLVSSFPSREALIQVLLASCFVLLYAGLRPVEHQGQSWVDGGLTNSLPVLPAGRTVTVSPFSGRSDISPQDPGQPTPRLTVAHQDVTLSVANLVRLGHALFPPCKTKLEALQRRGFADAVRFLRTEGRFEEDAPEAVAPNPSGTDGVGRGRPLTS